MLIDVRKLRDGQPCAILGLGHTVLPDEYRYDNRRFILEHLSDIGRADLRTDLGLEKQTPMGELLDRADAKFTQQTGIRSRYIFPGSVADLGTLAAQAALQDAGISAGEIDAIIVGTNTSDSYTLATEVKAAIGAPTSASVLDTQVACPTGVAIVKNGWLHIRSRCHRRVLIVGVEKTSTLASADNYKAANLFGDAAFAMVLGAAEQDHFVFFDDGSDPFDGKDKYIFRAKDGFHQDGKLVHKYVGTVVPKVFQEIFSQLNLDPGTVHHLFPHQPSAKTVDFFLASLQKQWPEFRATVHRNVENMGNTSAACTGWMMAQAKLAGQLQSGQFCLVASFGAGMSWGFYGFIVP